MACRAAALSAFALLLATAPAVADDPAGPARSAVEAFGRNIRSFERYRCRFAICHGTAATLDDLKAGRYGLTAMGAHLTVADGPRLKYHRYGKNERGGTKFPDEVLTEQETWLTDGTWDLWYNRVGTVNVYPPDRAMFPGEATPLTMGLFDLRRRRAPEAMLADPAGFQLVPDDLAATDGRPTVGVRFTGKPGRAAATWRYAFDPARGHLPARAIMSDDGDAPYHEVWLLEAADCGNGRYFPTKFISFNYPRGEEKMFTVRLYAVTELDPDHTPTRDDLSVNLPAGTAVGMSRDQHIGWIFLQRNTTVHVDGLPAVAADLDSRLPRKLDRTRLRELAGRFWPWAAALVGGLGAIFLAQLWLIRRRRLQPRLHGY